MVDDDKKDLGPFDDDQDDEEDFDYKPPEGYGGAEDNSKDKEKNKNDKGDLGKQKDELGAESLVNNKSKNSKDSKDKDNISDFDDEDFDDIIPPDFDDDSDDEVTEKPFVSVADKKNKVVIALVGLLVFYFGYQIFTESDEEKKKQRKPKNEIEEMSDEFRDRAEVPSETAGFALPKRERESDPLDDINVPPPPPPPPSFNQENIYSVRGGNDVSGVSGFESDAGFATGSSSGAVGASPSFGPGSSNSSFSGEGLTGGRFSGGRSQRFGGATGGGLPNLGSGFGEEVVISEEMKQRIQAPMFVGGASPDRGRADAERQGIFPEYEFELDGSEQFRTDTSYVGELQNIILQGKIIDAVLETAINTDLPGSLRAVISRDVYAESSKRVLIPKGSRLIGNYQTEINFGRARVYIVWNRVIRPDGIDAILDNNGMIATDLIGRTGVYGKLDNRFMEIFGSAVLLSTIQVAFAVAANEATGGENINSQITDDGNIVQSGDIASEAIQESVTNLGNQFRDIFEDRFNIQPRITIDQGTRIKIFVNRDIHFPETFKKEDDLRIIE